jgi:hypothetical protein
VELAVAQAFDRALQIPAREFSFPAEEYPSRKSSCGWDSGLVQRTAFSPNGVASALMRGRWVDAFKIGGLNLPRGVTEGDMRSIFKFGPSICGSAFHLQRYAEVIGDLLKLPTGRALVQRVFDACYRNLKNNRRNKNKKLGGVLFASEDGESEFRGGSGPTCVINVEKRLFEFGSDDWILLARDGKSGRLKFLRVDVPPAIVLAHELNHFLYALERCSNVPGRDLITAMNGEAKRVECETIFRDIVVDPENRPAEMAFSNLWNHGKFSEVANILPMANILKDDGRLNYSDGIVIGEALLSGALGDQIRFFDSASNAENINYWDLTAENFIRFSHASSEEFFDEFNNLTADEQDEFRKLVQNLLSKITIDGHSGTINDLPRSLWPSPEIGKIRTSLATATNSTTPLCHYCANHVAYSAALG